MLFDIGDVAELVSGTRQFKPNCALVITDFLVRLELVIWSLSDTSNAV